MIRDIAFLALQLVKVALLLTVVYGLTYAFLLVTP
jgi:hypothetical protein